MTHFVQGHLKFKHGNPGLEMLKENLRDSNKLKMISVN